MNSGILTNFDFHFAQTFYVQKAVSNHWRSLYIHFMTDLQPAEQQITVTCSNNLFLKLRL